MDNGALLLWRTRLESPLWQDAALWRLWSWCLLAAARKSRTVTLGGVPARLSPGELAAQGEQVCAATGLTRRELRRCLTAGKNLGLLQVRTLPWGLRISVVNWQESVAAR